MGDFIASGLAQGLEAAYAENPNVVVIRQTNGSSTIVRPDYYNWNVKSVELIAEHKPNLVVFNIGANDRQDITVDGKILRRGEDAWWVEYSKRVADLASGFQAQNVNFLWVGVPSFKFSKMTADVLAFNGIYRQEVEKFGGVFVDIWDGFVDVNGNFIYTGSDINGQQVRLRASDGINLTTAGKRKLAFYVEKPAARYVGNAFNSLLSGYDSLNQTIMSAPIRVQDPRLAKRTKVFSFMDPELDGGDMLLGGDVRAVSYKKKSPARSVDRSGPNI